MRETLVPVTSVEQADVMRKIRNTCREFMTNDRTEIDLERQTAWFESIKNDPDTLPFLFKPRPLFTKPIGFGLIAKRKHRWWLTGGLLPECRGKGYGTQLFGDLADYVHQMKSTAWLTVWEHNERAIATYKKLGFVFDSIYVDAYAPPIMVMRAEPPPSLRLDIQ